MLTMPTKRALFLSISGQRYTHRTQLYNRLKKFLPDRFPGKNFEFIGSPFNRLPFPLVESTEDREDSAATRLMGCWTKLNRFCDKRLRPLLHSEAVIITHGFGLDALLYATACAKCQDENDEAIRLHNGLVHLRLHEQGVEPPEYFITRANVRTLDARMMKAMPELAAMAQSARIKFIRYEESAIREYFERIKNQKDPHFIDADDSVQEMVRQVVEVIEKRLRHRAAA